MNIVLAVVAIIGASASGPLMAAAAAPALAISFWRTAGATVVLSPFAAHQRQLRRMDRRGWLTTLFAGVMLAGHFAAWATALKLTSVAAATALVCTQLFWIVLIERLRGVRTSTAVLVGIAVAVTGVIIVSGVDVTVSTRALVGDLLAVVGGLCAALYFVAGSHVRTVWSTTTYTAVCYGICAGALAIACLASGTQLAGFSTRAWILIATVTVCAQLLAHSILNHLLAVMSPGVLSLLLLLEVPGSALLAGIFLDQTPAAGVYVGLVVIVVGLFLVVRSRPATADVLTEAG